MSGACGSTLGKRTKPLKRVTRAEFASFLVPQTRLLDVHIDALACTRFRRH
jgi:hypothetical protein